MAGAIEAAAFVEISFGCEPGGAEIGLRRITVDVLFSLDSLVPLTRRCAVREGAAAARDIGRCAEDGGLEEATAAVTVAPRCRLTEVEPAVEELGGTLGLAVLRGDRGVGRGALDDFSMTLWASVGRPGVMAGREAVALVGDPITERVRVLFEVVGDSAWGVAGREIPETVLPRCLLEEGSACSTSSFSLSLEISSLGPQG